MRTGLRTSLSLIVVASVCAATSHAGEQVDFTNDLIPLFTKHGCNAGACHGAAIGRGGFKLSLYGGDAKSDYAAIVQQANGRRVNLAKPDKSLIVLKPAEYITHGGGTVFDLDSDAARLLLAWIREGTSDRSPRKLISVTITPRHHVAKAIGEPVALKALAKYSDGTTRDVTRWTIYKAEDASSVNVANDVARPQRRGRHIVVARYLSEVVPIEIVVPISDATINLSAQERHNFIDEEVLAKLGELRLQPSSLIDDASFLRRITLDLTGRLPTKQTAARINQGKVLDRKTLIDGLLKSNEFTEYWTFQLAKLLRLRPQVNDKKGVTIYHGWLTNQVRDDVNYRQTVRDLILTTGDSHENGPANFYRTVKGPRKQAELMSELFMGSRLRCANCHNHPLDRWTQDDYHGLAAIFAKVESGRIIKAKPRGVVIHPRTLEVAVPKIPGERFLAVSKTVDDVRKTDGSELRLFADWLTGSTNPYFAKAIVNRLWKRLMGRGLVEPVDDFRATNPATHPTLLEKLATDFVAHDYSLRRTLKVIASSAAYARSANATQKNKDDDRFYSHALKRPLEPEVLSDVISDVLGIATKYGDEPLGVRAVALIDPGTPSRTLDVLGRCGRQDSCESTPPSTGGLPQKLHLLNGPLLNARISAKTGRLNRLLSAETPASQIVAEFYLVAFSRRPSKIEYRYWHQQLEAAENQRDFLEDFVWGLLTSREFVTNH